MDRFSKLNPKACFLFFLSEIILCLIIFNPFYLSVSFLSAFLYNVKLKGKEAVESFFKFILPLTLIIAVFNMIFSHYGDTVLFSLFTYDFTLESLFFGLNQGMMFASVIMWISCYSLVITSDKFLSVFSIIAPNSALVFSMVLSFLPRLRKNADEIYDARIRISDSESKLKKSMSNFSALISMTLEESIEVSDSMKARGFGKGRRAYSKYAFSTADATVIIIILVLSGITIFYRASGRTLFIFEPVIEVNYFSSLSLILYALMSFLPLIIDFWEDMRWLYLKRKI